MRYALLLPTLIACTASTKAVTAAAPRLTLDGAHPTSVWIETPSRDGECDFVWSVGEDAPRHSPAVTEGDLMVGLLEALPESAAISVGVVCDGVAETKLSEITTGGVPSDMDRLTASLTTEPTDDGETMLYGVLSGEETAMVISDFDGRPVWWQVTTGGITHPRQDPVTGDVFAVTDPADGPSVFVLAPLTGEPTMFPVENAHHDAISLGDGRFLLTVSEFRLIDGESIMGDTLVVLDTETGLTSEVWNAFDQFEIVENEGWELGNTGDAKDWTHLNSLSLDPDTGKVLASFYWSRSVAQIDAVSWRTEWVMQGPTPDITTDVPFGPQHTVHMYGDSLAMFDNGGDTSEGSSLVRYAIDEKQGVANEIWRWRSGPSQHTPVLGSVAFHHDRVLASWGITSKITMLEGDVETASYALPVGMFVGTTSFAEVPR